MDMSCTQITFCVPSTPCANMECPRHRTHAPTELIGISVANLWPTCTIKQEYTLSYPKYQNNVIEVGGTI